MGIYTNIIDNQPSQRVNRRLTSRDRECEDGELNLVATLDGTRIYELLDSNCRGRVELELLRADLLSIADRIVATLVAGDLDVACLVRGSSTLTEVDDARKVKVFEVEGFGRACLKVRGNHRGALRLGDKIGKCEAMDYHQS